MNETVRISILDLEQQIEKLKAQIDYDSKQELKKRKTQLKELKLIQRKY